MWATRGINLSLILYEIEINLLFLQPEKCYMADKKLYIIAGPNGAGKTIASYEMLPELLNCREFVNADEIARGLSPFNPEEMALEAGVSN